MPKEIVVIKELYRNHWYHSIFTTMNRNKNMFDCHFMKKTFDSYK